MSDTVTPQLLAKSAENSVASCPFGSGLQEHRVAKVLQIQTMLTQGYRLQMA